MADSGVVTPNGDIQALSTFLESVKKNMDLLRDRVIALEKRPSGGGGGLNNEDLQKVVNFINHNVSDLRRLDDLLERAEDRIGNLDTDFGNRLGGLREEVNELFSAVNYGLSAEDLFPWAFGVAYNRRNVASAESSRGGTWVVEMHDGTVFGPLVGERFDWSLVRSFVFHLRDARGTDVLKLFRNPIFAEGGVPIGLLRKDGDVSTVIGWNTVGEPQRVGSYGYRFGVQRAAGFDEGQLADISPPHDTDYEVRLMLPSLERDTFGIRGRPRAAQHFWHEIDAILAAGLQALGDDMPWSGLAASEANAATDGPNRVGDLVTLYRGDFRQTRAWDPIDEEWVTYTPFFGGNLVGINGILATHIATDQILARHILAGEITADKIRAGVIPRNFSDLEGLIGTADIAAGAIVGDKIAANSIDATTKLTALQAAVGRLFVNFAQIRNVVIGNAHIENASITTLKAANRAWTDVISDETAGAGSSVVYAGASGYKYYCIATAYVAAGRNGLTTATLTVGSDTHSLNIRKGAAQSAETFVLVLAGTLTSRTTARIAVTSTATDFSITDTTVALFISKR